MRRIASLALLLAAPGAALGQAYDPNAPPPPPPGEVAQVPAPAEPPPQAPPPTFPAAPQEAPQPPSAPAGHWVHTGQYGWLWMPYGQEYTYIPPDPRLFPDMYVYYPAYGWRWVVAPWVYGYGPSPYWGPGGIRPFFWYSSPWFRVGGYWGWGGYRGWGRYRGWVGPQVWGPRGWTQAPAYYRSGSGGPHPNHVFRPAPARAGERGPAHERGPARERGPGPAPGHERGRGHEREHERGQERDRGDRR